MATWRWQKEGGKRSNYCRPELGKVPQLGSSWDVLPLLPSQKACHLGHSQCVGDLDLRTFVHAVSPVSRASLTSIGKYPLLRSGAWVGLLPGACVSDQADLEGALCEGISDHSSTASLFQMHEL